MTGDKGSILIVDDAPANLALLESLLRESGYTVHAAVSGRLALKSVRQRPPDLVLLDVNMPEMDGYEVCKALKSDPALTDIPVLFISAASNTSDKLRAFEEGGVDYLTKPFQPLEVMARVATHLALARTRRELGEKNAELERTMANLKLAQTHIVQSEKMAALGLLTAGIAHELNNPLNFIAASVQGLKKTVAPLDELIAICKSRHGNDELLTAWNDENRPDELRETMNELVDNACYGAHRAAEIIGGLRIFSRLDEADQKRVDLHENLDAALLLLHSRYMDGIRIDRRYGQIPSWVCQPGKLNQVFMNLLSNAIDAILAKPEPGACETIRISTEVVERDGTYCAVVEIADTGIGMPTEVVERLFEPFFTTKDVGKGVGLGLAISHGIVLDHGGCIEVESAEGKGSLFRVVLPQTQNIRGENRS